MDESIEKGDTNSDSGQNGSKGTTAAFSISDSYARFLTNFWYVICILAFATMTECGTIVFTLYKFPDLSDPEKGFEARGTVISARLRSFGNMLYRSDDYLVQQAIPPAFSGETSFDSHLSCLPEAASRADQYQPTIWFSASLWDWDKRVAKVIFEGVDGRDMLSASSLKSVCSAETNLISSHPMYQSNCLCHDAGRCSSTWSLGNYVALLSNKTSCQDITDSDVEQVIMLLEQCVSIFHNRTRSEVEDSRDFHTMPAECAQHDFALHTMLFFLLPSNFSESILKNESATADVAAVFFPVNTSERSALEAIYRDNLQGCSCSDGITKLKAVDFSLKYSSFSSLLLADSLYLGIGVLGIFILIWTYTGSFIVTLASLFNIAYSLVMAYFLYTVVFARPIFTFNNTIATILVIGIGADDAFVFMDLWKKSVSEIGENDLVALTRETLRHAATTMCVTSFTTTAALYACIISDITAIKCFGVFAGTAILMNLFLTLSITPAFVIVSHKLTNCTCRPKGKDDKEVATSHYTSNCVTHRQRLLEFLRWFFEGTLPSVVFRLRYVWIVIYLLFVAGGAVVIFYNPGLKLPSVEENQLLIRSHHFEQYDFTYKGKFSFSRENKLNVLGFLVWGVEAVDNGNLWDPDDWGTFNPHEAFRFSSPSDQEWLLDFCKDLKNQTFFKPDGLYLCFIETMKLVMGWKCLVHPITGQDASPCCGQTFPFPESVFNICLSRFHDAGYIPTIRYRINSSELAVLTVPFTMPYKESLSYAVNDELWTLANTWMESRMKSAPLHLQHGWFVPATTDIGFYDLQKSLASGTVFSILLTLGLGSLILIFTIQNVILAISATITIASTVIVTTAVLVLIGWELNIVESIVITLSVGLSVDFTIHYGVTYRLAPYHDRKSRTRYSLSTISGAISLAALSTFLAGAFMMPATVYGYVQFGIFLMIVMVVSWTYSTLFFQSLGFVIGPQYTTGNLPCSSLCGCFGYNDNRKDAPNTENPEPGIEDFATCDDPLSENDSMITNRRCLEMYGLTGNQSTLEGVYYGETETTKFIDQGRYMLKQRHSEFLTPIPESIVSSREYEVCSSNKLPTKANIYEVHEQSTKSTECVSGGNTAERDTPSSKKPAESLENDSVDYQVSHSENVQPHSRLNAHHSNRLKTTETLVKVHEQSTKEVRFLCESESQISKLSFDESPVDHPDLETNNTPPELHHHQTENLEETRKPQEDDTVSS
ncbi:protein dispatched homolog 1-like [Acanthaster planci]|uniref:Protein dispatched homolog 1-like n=1 Tax=Acanthaster planci TaxID=133434 RepID=A0A8B7Y196_ACAPL|nr:protein dispatched homolog 1-like [Acanthaster planci]